MKTKLSRIMFQIFNKTGLRPVSTRFILMVFLALTPAPYALSQVPQGFNYQAIARDGSGNPISDPVNVKIAILSDDIPETVIWEELHSGVDPDEHGLFNIVIGQGTWQEGLASFSLIDWTVTPLYIRTKINDVKLGIALLWSVPYAMVADSLGGPLKKLKVNASSTSTLDEALFEVKNKNGQTVFAVYNEGVRIYIGDGTSKAVKGGFSVGGFNSEKDENNKKYLYVDDDSVRIWVNDLGKSAKGGFSVGGFGYAKDLIKKYLFASEDSVRIYIDDTGKAAKGGFSVGGFTSQKALVPKYLTVDPNRTNIQVNDSSLGFTVSNIGTGTTQNFMRMNQINYRLGHESGEKLVQTMAKFNTFLGYKTGRNTTGGSNNIFLGYMAGYRNINANNNVYLGTESGYYNEAGINNVFLGFRSGYRSLVGNNIYIGNRTGYYNDNGAGNTYIGSDAGYWDGYSTYIAGTQNTFIGNVAGSNHYFGDYNVYIGAQAGNSSTGSKKVLIGYQAGYSDTRSNVLIIQNDNTKSPLIDGDFSTGIVTLNNIIKLTPMADPPSTPAEGQIYADTDHHLYYFNGTIWKQLD